MLRALVTIGIGSILFLVPPPASAADPGVTASSLSIGQGCVFSGPSAGLGVEYWRGTNTMHQTVNDKGGVAGRKMELVLCDDRYDPNGAANCTVELVKKKNVFILTNSVGTPTMVRILPFLHAWSKDNVFLFGNFTGAQPQRSMPYAPYVFNIRASYHQEVAGHVAGCLDAGHKKIGTYVQNDAYGKDGEEGARLYLKKKGKKLTAKTYYERHTKYDADVSKQVKILRDAGVTCVSTTGSYQGIGAFIRQARTEGWNVPIYGVSFTGADQMLTFLLKTEKETKTKVTKNVIMTQVVPHPEDRSFALVREFQDQINKYNPRLPPSPFDRGDYSPDTKYSFGALEGYMNTKVMVEVLKRVGPDLSRARFKEMAESLEDWDVGLGKAFRITWKPIDGVSSRYNHQALNKVWYTAIEKGKWIAVKEGKQLRKYNKI